MNKRTFLILGVMMTGILLTSLVGTSSAADNPLQRQTRFGIVEGFADDATKTWVWKGVPFAAPPVGALRWKAPQDPAPWKGVRETKGECTPCMQNAYEGSWVQKPEPNGSEDCLYVNIYRPQTDEEDLPVYFWIHGGANYFGYAELYDMRELARKANMVVVVTQYRLNAFGFFTHPALRVFVSAAEASGNFGTLDQIKALKWVRDNIAAFGGNPHNVTVGGESAGGHNTTAMIISPLAKGLFHRALMESGGMKSHSVAAIDEIADRTIDIALIMKGKAKDMEEAKGVRIKMTNAQIAALLRGLSAAELLRAVSGGPGQALPPLANLIEDGYVIPGNLLCTIESGNYNKVPIIAGSNEFENGSINTLLPPLYKGMPNYMALLDVVMGKKTLDEVLPTQKDKLLWTKARYHMSRFWRASMVDELVRRLAVHQDDIYSYSFRWGDEDVRPGALGFIYGASHALEIPFFQGNADGETMPDNMDWIYKGFTEQNRPGRKALTSAMVSYFAQFARTGDPNRAASGLPEWKSWSNHVGGPKAIILDADMNTAHIRMDNEEVSVASARYALDEENPGIQMHIKILMAVMQPYAAYETGVYEYNRCD
jgi:para-nitrobenzyl esterase